MTTQGSYGASNNESDHSNHSPSHADERNPLLPNKGDRRSSSAWRAYLTTDISRNKADLVLLFSYLTTGILDSTATAVWGSFVSMQTGNTVYLGLGLSDPTASTRWIKSLTSILCFCFGSFCFARYHRAFSAKGRWVLMSAVFLQMLCIVAAAVIVMVTPKVPLDAEHEVHWHVLVPLGLVAFQSSGQAVISRALKYGSLTSVVLTSIYCDLFSDAKFFASLTENGERNRRGAAPSLLLLGAVIGGLWTRTEIGITGALWMAVGLKFVVVVVWALWPAEKESED